MAGKKHRVLIALGGNALERPGGGVTAADQMNAVREAAVHICDFVEAGSQVIIAHGNGPQVGRILIQNDAAKDITPPLPLEVCDAMTQGYIGYQIQNAVSTELHRRRIKKSVVTVVTQVRVWELDPAFQKPSKPIGPFYTEAEARRIMAGTGYVLKEDAGRGWRRVVPSPQPVEVVEADSVELLIESGAVVIAVGGGGIPVVTEPDGSLRGVEAVIDKDLSSACLADRLDADELFILTAVPKIALNFGKPDQLFLDRVDTRMARRYCDEGHFAPGSMLPKVQAAVRFVSGGMGRRAIITSLECALEALRGENGTAIVNIGG